MTEDENRIIEALLSGDDPALDVIRNQIKLAQVTKRASTGAGMSANFAVADTALAAGSRKLSPRGIFGPMGWQGWNFILVVRGGLVWILEFAAWDGKVAQGGGHKTIMAPGHLTCMVRNDSGTSSEFIN